MFHLCSWVSSQSFFDQRTGNEQRNEKGATAVSSCKSFGPPWERPRSSQGFMAQAHTYTHTQTDRETRISKSPKLQNHGVILVSLSPLAAVMIYSCDSLSRAPRVFVKVNFTSVFKFWLTPFLANSPASNWEFPAGPVVLVPVQRPQPTTTDN